MSHAEQQHRILIHFGELGLKGQNRKQFQNQLARSITAASRAAGSAAVVSITHDHLFVHLAPHAAPSAKEIMACIAPLPGIAWLADAQWLPRTALGMVGGEPRLSELTELVTALARDGYREGASFSVRVHRQDKRFAMTSPELARYLGAAVGSATEFERVDLKHPDQCLHVDILPRGVYVYGNRVSGVGGLPLGSVGRVMVLLSGGLDSPVAAHLMSKRGCELDFVHFTASILDPEKAQSYKLTRIAAELSRVAGRCRLFLVPYVHFDIQLGMQTPGFATVLFRRFMVRVATRLAQAHGAQALVTGDSLGQVASQTMENLVSCDQATTTPIFRPLIAMDKNEIVGLCRRIGLFELCVEPYKDCCALISAKPRTKTRPKHLQSLEQHHVEDYAKLIEDSLDEGIRVDLLMGAVQRVGKIAPR